jgi:cysteine desulfurase/selenocysteine lyase
VGAAIDYLTRIDHAQMAAYEHDLLAYGTEALSQVPGLRLTGTAPQKAGGLTLFGSCRFRELDEEVVEHVREVRWTQHL